MKELQARLSEDLGYSDKGIYIDGLPCSEIKDKKTAIRASYFTIGNLTIESYTKKIDKIITKLRQCTGSKKVDIITHSMGGIVVRNYIHKIDNSSIRTFIMLGTPNHGGLYNTKAITDYFKEEWQFNTTLDFMQLTTDSEFMLKLNKDEGIEGVDYYTLAGDIDGKGDGIVLKDSVRLKGEKAYKTVDCFHMFLKHPLLCPEAYEFIKKNI